MRKRKARARRGEDAYEEQDVLRGITRDWKETSSDIREESGQEEGRGSPGRKKRKMLLQELALPDL